MELLKYLNNTTNQQEQDYTNLIVKEAGPLNLITYKHDQEFTQRTPAWVRNCKGIILERATNKIVCYTFDKFVDDFSMLSPNFYVEDAIDGTQIRVFYYADEWHISTTRCIDADKAYWFSGKSFKTLFMEAVNACGLSFDRLNKKCSYSFVLCHPENRIVVKYDKPMLYHVLTRDMESLLEIDHDIGVQRPNRYQLSQMDVAKQISAGQMPLQYEGLVVVDDRGNRLKLQYEEYKMFREIRGNANNLFFNYLNMRKNGLVDMFLAYYSEYTDRIQTYQCDLSKLFNYIYQVYVMRFIKHELDYDSTPEQLRHIIYLIHGEYLKTHHKVSFYRVAEMVNRQDPKLICHMFNKSYKPHWRETVLIDMV
jgi:hypothetical protein